MEVSDVPLGICFSSLRNSLERAAALSLHPQTSGTQSRGRAFQPALFEELGLLLAYKSEFYLGLFARAEKKKEGGYSNVEILEENLCAPLCENPSPLMGQTDWRPDLPFDSVEI